MRLMGDKVSARKAMEAAGVPVVPGSPIIETDRQAEEAVERIGLPVIIKATGGGGGRGMKIVDDKARLFTQLASARAEAQAGFNNPAVYLERYIGRPPTHRSAVLGDGSAAIAMGERECSIQRRHQKLIEEAPSWHSTTPGASSFCARHARPPPPSATARLAPWNSCSTKKKHFYFIEMNTRIQVEHTVTEMVFGVDLVREQMRLAAGDPIRFPRTCGRAVTPSRFASTPRIP